MLATLTLELTWVLLGSFGVCALLILTQRWHGKLSLDHDLSGAQKLHHTPVPRVGGLAIALGLLIGAVASSYMDGQNPLLPYLLACSAPVFAAGLIEDLTKKVSVKNRLYASFVSAGLAIWLLDAQLTRLDTPILENLVSIAPLSVLFTCFAVGGMTNAVNIIDGLNGLAGGCVTLMLGGLAAIAWQVGDSQVLQMCLWGMAAILGFLILNYPFGRIFLGDGGAYLAGFWLAECGVLLLHRNPEVSTWAVLLCCLYPFWETIFSMYRRHVVLRVSSGVPDMAHFHHLVYARLANAAQIKNSEQAWLQHGASSATIWMFAGTGPIAAAIVYNQAGVLSAISLLLAAMYIYLYRRLTLEPSAEATDGADDTPDFNVGVKSQ